MGFFKHPFSVRHAEEETLPLLPAQPCSLHTERTARGQHCSFLWERMVTEDLAHLFNYYYNNFTSWYKIKVAALTRYGTYFHNEAARGAKLPQHY